MSFPRVLLVTLTLSGCAATPVPVGQPVATLGLAEARHVIDEKKNWTYCYQPSGFSCLHPYTFSSVRVRGGALQLDNYSLPLAGLAGLGIVDAGHGGGTAYLTLQEGINFPMGSGEAGTRAAQRLADALLALKAASSDEAVAATEARFEETAAHYRAADPKPVPDESVRRLEVQIEDAVREKRFEQAAALYDNALELAPWWPQGRFNHALLLEALGNYEFAIEEMQRYLMLVPEAPNARAAQDKIYSWQGRSRR